MSVSQMPNKHEEGYEDICGCGRNGARNPIGKSLVCATCFNKFYGSHGQQEPWRRVK